MIKLSSIKILVGKGNNQKIVLDGDILLTGSIDFSLIKDPLYSLDVYVKFRDKLDKDLRLIFNIEK